ncbi:MAG: cyclic nucleotide-binding domain-containing protein [Deltaproteobacteria bacterium]|nr:cyclic nucleotide-binding domain-containing protein [Deltaproteobacteria bacterium]
MPPRFESRPILSRRAYTATLRGTMALGWETQLSFSAHLFCIIAANVIARNVANKEVLDTVGPASLGSLYVVVAILSGGLLAAFGWLSRSHNARQVAVVTHIAVGLAMISAALIPPTWHEASLVKYVLMEISAAATLLVFGRLLGNHFGPREARKIAPRIGAGGIIGGLVGGGILSLGAHLVGSRWLFLIAAMAVVTPVAWLIRIQPEERLDIPLPSRRMRDESTSLASYGRALAIVTFLMVATTTLIDYVFRFSAKRYYDADELTQFFGNVVLLSGIVAIVFQLTVLDRLLDRLGVFATAAVMPAAIAVAGALFGAAPFVATLAILKLIDSGTNMTVQQSTGSLMLAPLGPSARSVWQSRIDGLAKRSGQVAIGLFLAFFPWAPNRLLPLTMAFCAFWLISIAVTRLRYIRMLTQMVRGGEEYVPTIQAHDGETIRLLENELTEASPTRAAVILDLLADSGHRAQQSSLQRITKSGELDSGLIVLEHLVRLRDLKSIATFVSHPQPEVAVRALVATAEIDVHAAQKLARIVLSDRSRLAPVRATAAALLGDTEANALKLAYQLATDKDPLTREALALGLSAAPTGGSDTIGKIIVRLAGDYDEQVAIRALEALPRHATDEAIEIALRALERPRVRVAAMRALSGVGAIAAERVAQELAARMKETRIAIALVFVAGRLASPIAVGALMETLWSPHAELRLAGAIALSSLKRRRAGVVIPLSTIAARYKPEIEFYARMRDGCRAKLTNSRASHLLLQLFKQRAQASLECLFRMLALRYPEDALRGSLLALSSSDKRQRQIALELLDTLIEPELRQALGAAVSETARQKRARDVVAVVTYAAVNGDSFLATLARRTLVDLKAPVPPHSDNIKESAMSDDLIRDILALQEVNIFSQSSAEDLAELNNLLVDTKVKKGTVLFVEGETGNDLYLIRIGRIAMNRKGSLIETLGPGDALGVISILDQKPRELTATAVTDCELRVLSGENFMQLLSERPLFMHSLFRVLSESIRGQLDRIALGKRTDASYST